MAEEATSRHRPDHLEHEQGLNGDIDDDDL